MVEMAMVSLCSPLRVNFVQITGIIRWGRLIKLVNEGELMNPDYFKELIFLLNV